MASTQPSVIRGGLLLDGGRYNGEAADILVDGDEIKEIGPPGLAVSEDAAEVDADDTLIIPGLVNAHTHGDVSLAKGLGDRWSLEMLLNAAPLARHPDGTEGKYLAAKLAAVEMVLSGCTACYDLFSEFQMTAHIQALKPPHGPVYFHHRVRGRSGAQMISIGVGGVDERALQSVGHPAVDDVVALMRFIFVSVAPPPFIKRPGVREYVAKCPRAGEVLRFEVFFLEGREIPPISVLVAEGGDIGIGAHSGAGQKQNPLAICQKFRALVDNFFMLLHPIP